MSSPPDEPLAGSWITYENGKPAAVHLRRCRLEVLRGPDAGQSHTFDRRVVHIGAGAANDLVLTDRKISARHAELRLDRHGFRLRDLESTNGTVVGRHRVQDTYLNPGDLIAIGHSRLRFEALAESTAFQLSANDRFGELIGRSPAMRELFAQLEKLAESDTTVLIAGPTGAGKELVALALHEASPRRGAPLEVVDCSAIPANLIESELFGHEKGAFTGATTSRAGAFERAHGGTLFLDEIGEMPLALQPRLLRALEAREVRRVGGDKPIAVDLRVLAATNRDLGVEVDAGRFRADLYFRLAVARVEVPPLSERRDDIPLLVEHLAAGMRGGHGLVVPPATMARLVAHDWPGNVRELRNVVERLVFLGDVGERLVEAPARAAATDGDALQFPVDLGVPLKQAKQALIDAFERAYVSRLLEIHGGNVSATAREAGMDRMAMHKIVQKLGLARR